VDNETDLIEAIAYFASGLVTIVALHSAYGWWLNSGADVWRTSVVLAVWSLAAAVWHRKRHVVRAAMVWLGTICGSAVMLFWNGPGNIWPIALAVAGGIAAAAVLAGTLVGAAANAFRP
jgi:hypothetical protein